MFFNADDDENDFMSTGGGSKLANLFGMDKASRQGGNESLTYTAPKQPRKKESTPDGGAAPVVVVASVVHAYKYVDGKYAPQGKLGAALLANHGAKDYRILLYVTQQKQITNAKISLTFAFNVQQNNYASFYDDTRQMWSIMFESVDAAEKFAKEVAVAKANSVSGTLTDLIQQDLLLGEGGLLESGDSAEVKYIGWLLTNGALGKVFDQSQQDNYFRFRVGKGKVIKGWDQGMLGMKKGAKRILIIPPSLAYGSQGAGERVPPDSTLVFEVQVMRVKLQKGDSPQPSPAPTPAPVAMPALPNDNDDLEDLGVKGRTKSINEHLTQSPDSNKAKLISRMARMGQPMLPLQGAIPAQPDESDEEMHPHIETPPAAVKPSLAAKPRSMSGVGVGMAPTSAQVIVNQAQPTVLQSMGNPPMMMTMDGLLHQPQPDFLQNLPGAQQLAVYQNPNTFLQQQQQQQAALIQQQQQQLLQQQQQLLGHGLIGGVQGPGGPFAAQPSQPDSLAPALLSETRQQNTEIRINLSKMSDKVDKILEKLDHMSNTSMMGQMNQNMHMMGSLTPYGSSMTAPSMEASVLMQNITRIVQENERLKKDLYDQSNKVQEQNEKIAKLLEQNQRYVEQSHNMLEQRNEGYKTTASQSQAKVLSLEQEKVHLATELSSASAQISTLQLELAEYRKREGELKQQIQLSTNFNLTSKEELDQLRLQREEDEQKVAVLTASIREEKQARKASDAKLTSITEELNDLRASHVTLEKNLTERKRKALEDRRKLEEDMEEAKQNYEHTIESLREKLRKQKTSVDAETDFKVSKIEEDLTRELQAKYDRNMAVVTEKHNRQIEDLKSEKDELLRKIDEQEKKIASIRSSGTSTEKQVQILQDELADMKVWKEKYDSLRNQAAAMKDKYEKRLEEMEGEMEQEEEKRNEIVEKAKEQRQDLLQQIQQLQQQLQQMRKQLQAASESAHQRNLESSAPSADVTQEVKKIMNTVFQTLRAEFDSEENYSGDEVLSTILNVIKQTTLKLVNQSAPKQEESEGENEEESEKEEEDEQEDKKKKKEEGVDEVDDEDEEPISAVSLPQVSTEPTKPLNLSVSEQTSEKSSIPETQAEEEEVETSPETPANNTEISAKVEESPLHPETKDEFQTGVAYKSEGENNSAEANTKHIFAEDEKAAFERDNDAGATSPQLDEDADEQFENALDDIPSSDTPVAAAPLEGAKTSNGLDSGDLSSEKSESESSTQQGKIENTKEEISEELKKLNLAASTVVAPKARTDVIDQPPPLFDDDEDEDSPLFGNDDTVSDTLGAEFTPKARSASSNNNVPVNDPAKNKTTSGKKEQANEEAS
ncbi:FK506-binding protein 15 [Biomphalaria pfeifferi]|uniref:peptidylprolyl isomerase n=1 Tax=Biomphalaria pfeifferi TaxID=112525 RepID=A0AAD8F7S6_BIOPF|nr:FK506-binding protein 15 [Biomphalaria pfeifferi]